MLYFVAALFTLIRRYNTHAALVDRCTIILSRLYKLGGLSMEVYP
jgi:hypothetical protein